MTETIKHNWSDGETWFEAPLLGMISGCEPTDYGWCGVMPDGGIIEMRGRLGKPSIPAHHILAVAHGRVTGAYLIKRKRRSPGRKQAAA
jgi:hypothetical protein